MKEGKLAWQKKLPLALLMSAQALVVFRWFVGDALPPSVVAMLPYVTTVVGIAAAVALDVAVVYTALSRRSGNKSVWGTLATLSAMLFSSAVALSVYGVIKNGDWLHAAFPIVTFFYAQHLAAERPAEHTAQEYEDAMLKMVAQVEAMVALVGQYAPDGTIGNNGVLSLSKGYECPSCGSKLDNAGQLGAAVRWGYCDHCKKPTNGNGNGHKVDNIQEMKVVA